MSSGEPLSGVIDHSEMHPQSQVVLGDQLLPVDSPDFADGHITSIGSLMSNEPTELNVQLNLDPRIALLQSSSVTESQREQIFRQLFIEHFPKCRSVAGKSLKDPGDAEDIALDAISKAFSQIHKFKPMPNFETWVVAITKYTTIDRIRRQERRKDISYLGVITSAEDNPLQEDLSEDPADLVTENSGDSLQNLLKKQLGSDLLNCLLLVANGFSYDEIAVMEGITRETVNSRLRRARRAARKIVKEANSLD